MLEFIPIKPMQIFNDREEYLSHAIMGLDKDAVLIVIHSDETIMPMYIDYKNKTFINVSEDDYNLISEEMKTNPPSFDHMK